LCEVQVESLEGEAEEWMNVVVLVSDLRERAKEAANEVAEVAPEMPLTR
jgi:hypothetical protein